MIIGNYIGSQGGGGVDADVSAWLDRGTALSYTLPSTTVQNALSDFVKSLKANGLFTRMKTGYIMHAGSSQMATLNLKNPLTYQTTLVNSPTFSEGNGMKSNGSTSYINQPFKSNEYAGIETDLTVINYISESSTSVESNAAYGMRTRAGTGDYLALTPFYTATSGIRYQSHAGTDFPNTNHKGIYCTTYDGTNAVIYLNGVKTSTLITPLVPDISINRLLLCVNNASANEGIAPASFYIRSIATDFLFDRFSDTDELNFRTAFNTYKIAAGLP